MAIGAISLVSIWFWPPYVLPSQIYWQLAVAILVLVLFGKAAFKRQYTGIVSYDETGQWLWLQPQSSQQWQIGFGSRSAGSIIWLQLHSVLDNSRHRLILFKDAIPDQDFRRLKRIVLRQIKQGGGGNVRC